MDLRCSNETLRPAILVAALAAFLQAQTSSEPRKALHIGAGVSAPRLIHKVEPQYSPLARADRVQGTVVLSLIVDERGLPQDIQVISPLGFGLDERAEEAIRKWRFAPGMKEGQPVPVIAQVEVNFRFPRIWFDAKAEARRTSFNVAVKNLDGVSEAARQKSVQTIQDLASQQFPAAMFVAGAWTRDGDHGIAKDEDEGWRLIQRAADKNYGPALYEVAIRKVKAGGDPEEMEKQRETIRDAAVLGSVEAQFYLGQVYEGGIGVPQDSGRARRYFRLCAVKGEPLCQFRLARLMLNRSERTEDDYEQAVAWLELAADRKIGEASALLANEQPRLSAAQQVLIGRWKQQLAPKPSE